LYYFLSFTFFSATLHEIDPLYQQTILSINALTLLVGLRSL